MERPMSHPFDASRSLTVLEQDSTIIAVIEMSQSKWLVSAVVPGIERQPLKKLDPDEEALRKLLHRWRNEAGQAGREIKSWRAGSPDKSVLIRTAAFSARRPWGHGKGDDQTQRTGSGDPILCRDRHRACGGRDSPAGDAVDGL